MAEPTKKSEAVEQFLTDFTGTDRRETIHANKCISAPIGCGRTIEPGEMETWDMLSQREYTISGLCKTCQDSVFGED